MGCCSPNYTDHVKEQEQNVNKTATKEMPFWFKVISVMIILVSIIYFL